MLASITDIRETRFVLQPDLRILPVTALSERVRASLECDDGDFAVARPRSRRPASIVDPATAALLEEFRRPSRLVDAVLRFGRARGADPEPILDQAFAILCRFCHSGLLVPEGSEEQGGIQPSFAPGQELDGFEVLRLVHLLDDTELYQARSAEGALVALKIHRPDPSAAGAGPLVAGVDAIDREAAILARLGGRYAPALVATGAIDGRPYIAAEWRPGTSIAAVADELRGLPTARGRGALLDLCRRVLAAYQFLHAQGVIHGDVHPGNLLADADGSITLIDFGASRLLDPDSPYRHAARTGVGYYCDPGAARALLAGRMPPPASAASDQYALAVLLYRMLAGGHPVDFRAEQDELMRQVLHARPLPFARRGAEPWPEVERILVRALRKQPARRFESVAAFRRALIVVGLPGEEAARPARAVSALDRVGAALARVMVGSPLFGGGMPSPPIASVWSGGGGVAWFAYRVAGIRGDGPLLALADAWAARSLDAAGDPRAFASPERGITPERVAAVSPFHSIGGLHAVAALIARARGDAVMQREQVERFVLASSGEPSSGEPSSGASVPIDLATGRAGALLVGTVLLEAGGLSAAGQALLRGFVADRAADLARAVEPVADLARAGWMPHLGLAHGWAGLLYALLRAGRALGSPPSVREQLDQLAALGRPAGRGMSWPGTLPGSPVVERTPDDAPGWCAGSAGHVHLWLLAHDVSGEARHLALAERAAWAAWEHPDRSPSLCCGVAGRGLSLLRLYQRAGDPIWRDRAAALLAGAERAGDVTDGDPGADLGLYRGELGPALLEAELECPEHAVMPLFGC